MQSQLDVHIPSARELEPTAEVTPEVGAALALDQDELRHSFPAFVRRVFGEVDPGAVYQHGWHIDAMCEGLEACGRGEINRLIINVPPRSLKSITVSVAWAAWLLGKDPTAQIMASSYHEDLAFRHSLDCRFVIEAPWYQGLFPGTQIATDQNEKRKFQTTRRGYRVATSVGQARIGEGGDFLIMDDPHNPRQAQSDVERQAALFWYDRTFSTRLNDKKHGVMVLVMQRLHDRDMTGHLIEKGGWTHLCLPAEAPKRTVVEIGGFQIERDEGERFLAARCTDNPMTQRNQKRFHDKQVLVLVIYDQNRSLSVCIHL